MSNVKLSTAIREGAKLRPQCHYEYWLAGGTCAMGAAIEYIKPDLVNVGLDMTRLDKQILSVINTNWRAINDSKIMVACPADCPPTDDVMLIRHMVAHLNDFHEWTREAIADWLASIGY